MIPRRSIFWLFLILAPIMLAACSDTSAQLGQVHLGRILTLTVLEIDRTDELRYSTIDPTEVVHRWRMQPSKEGQELLLLRFRLENNIAVSAVFVADERAVILRGFFQDEYFPLSVAESVYLDRRGESDVRLIVEAGRCTAHPNLLVNAGTNIEWADSEDGGEIGTTIQFGPDVLPELGADPVEIAPGKSVSHRFGQPGTFEYECNGGEEQTTQAKVLVEDAGSVRDGRDNNILFLENNFELPKGTGVDGWMVFEVPTGTKIQDLRWRSGDTITIRF